MAIGAITMILANVGLQIYNNWCGCRQNAALQQKREEFERAAKERNTEHMWRLMREGQELTLQLEKEKLTDRLNELKDEVDHLLEKLTYETTISNWPLKVLPIVMKNQAFGNLLANQEENVAMHVIFTHSNYDKFNKFVYPIVEKQLEQYCDKHWSTMTDHPILFYSGAWKPMVNPTDVQVTAMREELKNLPTLLITPFFRPDDGKLVFQLHMWGVGANSTDKFDVPEIEPTDFQRPFNNQDDYDNEPGLLNEIVEDLVPYLECMIGYMADTYFWSSAGLAPHLPFLVTNGTINTDGMKYLISDSREYYEELLAGSEDKAKANPFVQENLLDLCQGCSAFMDKEEYMKKLEDVFVIYCCKKSRNKYDSLSEVIHDCPFNASYKKWISAFLNLYDGIYKKDLKDLLILMEGLDFDYSILANSNKTELLQLANDDNYAALYRLGELYEFSIGVKNHLAFALECYEKSANNGFILATLKIKVEKYEKIDRANCKKLKFLHNAGVEQASILLSKIYFYGLGGEKDIEVSMNILNSVPDSTHPYYYYTGAVLLNEAYGEDEKKAIFKLFKKAADMGYVSAIEKIMMIYLDGSIVPKCPERHFEYAKKCAEQGSLLGITRLGYCYAIGLGVTKSVEQAIKVLKIAEKRNYPDAIKLLNILESDNGK